jgi:hypothetical protein
MKKITNEEFISRVKVIHNDKYDYSNLVYGGNRTPITIICPIHGEFTQSPKSHLNGNGCKKCYFEKATFNRNTLNEFIVESNKVHKNKYDYSKTVYLNSKTLSTIICPTHGEFEQIPNSHMLGFGCPKCGQKYDKTENELKDFIKGLGFDFLENSRKIIYPFELDIYIPSLKIAIEYDGLYWHCELNKPDDYHLKKTEICEANGIQLIHIFGDEWVNKKDIVKSRLINILGITKDKIYARKCQIKEIDSCKEFLNDNHLQGYVNSAVNIGLFYNNELVTVMTFGNLRKSMGSTSKDGTFELLRFCNKINITTIGGADKLMKYFIRNYKPNEIVSYADRRWSQGHLYEKLGFSFVHDSKPNYFYLVNNKRLNRFKFRKDILIKEGFDKDKTEREIMFERKIYRIYDCGTKKYSIKLI